MHREQLSFDMPADDIEVEPLGEVDLDQARALPRLDAQVTGALSLLYSRGQRVALQIRETPFALHWDARRHLAQQERLYRFTLGPHFGYLGLDFFAESLLLGEERNIGLLPLELRYLLLADALHPLVQRVEQTLGLPFEWAPPDRHAQSSGVAALEHDALFRVEHTSGIRAGVGFVRFEDSTGFETLAKLLSTVRARISPRTLDWLLLPVALVIGTTELPLGTARQIEPGDVVVIDTAHPTPGGLPLIARIQGADGMEIHALADASRITVQSWSPMTMSQTPDAASSEQPDELEDDESRNDTWDQLQVPLRFEIGGLSISLAELQGLQAGYVFDLKQPLHRSEVRVLAHGRQIGTGYLVAVGDRLAVRVAQLATRPDE